MYFVYFHFVFFMFWQTSVPPSSFFLLPFLVSPVFFFPPHDCRVGAKRRLHRPARETVLGNPHGHSVRPGRAPVVRANLLIYMIYWHDLGRHGTEILKEENRSNWLHPWCGGAATATGLGGRQASRGSGTSLLLEKTPIIINKHM